MTNPLALALDGLSASSLGRSKRLSLEDGWAVIRARQRGVTLRVIGDRLGMRPEGVLRALGSWAGRYCRCGSTPAAPAEPEGGKP
jgi:hypothetical protein